jgi:hypothetical protein
MDRVPLLINLHEMRYNSKTEECWRSVIYILSSSKNGGSSQLGFGLFPTTTVPHRFLAVNTSLDEATRTPPTEGGAMTLFPLSILSSCGVPPKAATYVLKTGTAL